LISGAACCDMSGLISGGSCELADASCTIVKRTDRCHAGLVCVKNMSGLSGVFACVLFVQGNGCEVVRRGGGEGIGYCLFFAGLQIKG
jgi:hypothetical protein